MNSARKFVVVLITAPNLKTARALAKVLLRRKLAACVNILPNVESHYWWQKKLQASAELLLVVKTVRIKLSALEKCALAHHPYDTPEIIALPIASGNKHYLDWLAAN